MRRLIVLVALSVPVFLTPLGVADAAATRRCQEAVIFNGDGSVYTQTRKLSATGVTCARARQIAGRALSSYDSAEPDDSPYGLACSSSGTRVTCRRGDTRVGWGYYGDAGRACSNTRTASEIIAHDLRASGLSCTAAKRLIRRVATVGNDGGRACSLVRPCRRSGYKCVGHELSDMQFHVTCIKYGRRVAFSGGGE